MLHLSADKVGAFWCSHAPFRAWITRGDGQNEVEWRKVLVPESCLAKS